MYPEKTELKDSEGERICRKFLRETVGVLLKNRDGNPGTF